MMTFPPLAQPQVQTPCPGMLMRRTSNGIPVVRVDHWADEAKPYPEWTERERKNYTSDAWFRLEVLIQYEALSGQRVYPEFDPAVHVIPDDQVPRRMCRFMAIDPHPRTPHAFLWVGIDRWSDWYCYRELWPSKVCGRPESLKDTDEEEQWITRDYAETVAVLEGNSIDWHNAETDAEYGRYRSKPGGENIIYRFMDQAGKAFKVSAEGQPHETFASRYADYGIQCSDPYKIHQAGEDAIRDLLKPRRHEFKGMWPRLHVAASCRETILEFLKYRYKVTRRFSEERELKQEGVDARCHLLDLMRYLAVSNISYYARLES